MQNRDTGIASEILNGSVIGIYDREFYCLSNFASFAVEWKGRVWMTSEHAYQAAKFIETAPEVADKIHAALSAYDSKQIADVYKDRVIPNWKDINVKIMEEICKNKLEQHSYIREKLLKTEDLLIVEDSPTDSFWGWGSEKKGRNELGKIWMKLRSNIQTN